MNRLVLRHVEQDDIEPRLDLMAEDAFQRNLAHVATVSTREDLHALVSDVVENQQDTKMSFVIETRSGEIIGYTWITGVDWINRSCELSVAILPQHRHGHGLLALVTMYDFLYDQMNFATVVNQVLVGNEMLLSTRLLQQRRQVECRLDSFTRGEFRDAVYWAQTRDDHHALVGAAARRNARIRKRLDAGGAAARQPAPASAR